MAKTTATASPDFHIIIPARFQSKRLPGKPLLEIQGKPLIERVYERALLCKAKSVCIATDDERIFNYARKIGAKVCLTKDSHPTGTDRIAEAADILGLKDDDLVINLQGDEPLIPVDCVRQLVFALQAFPQSFMSTLCTPIVSVQQLRDPNVVKVVLDKNGFALYFSRSIIPYPRDDSDESDEDLIFQQVFYRHIGVYGFQVRNLKQYPLFETCIPEIVEQVEPIRILWQGKSIHVTAISEPLPPGVDTMAELLHMRKLEWA